MMKRLFTLAALPLALAACQDTQEPLATAGAEAPSFSQSASGIIPGRFIITVRDGVSPAAVARDHGLKPQYVYEHALNGFAGAMSDAARDGLLRDARVSRVEPDGIARISTTTQTDATWGLDRIDARSGLDGLFTYTSTGTGVKAYIIDTGIYTGHLDFGGRAVHGYDAVDGDYDASDCNGHGTHVAGTVGGTTWGVAKAATLVAVRVLDCGGSGTWSGVIAGMDWVTADHAAGTPAVANMSLGGGANSSVDAAVQRMIDDGIATAVAAGNGNMGGREQDACGYSPARVADAMTIGATTQSDSKTSWSNYGSCVDWFAPGYQITSAWHNDDYSKDGSYTRTISGTSMATPHVAGAAALYLEGNPGATALQTRDALYAATTKNIVTNSRTDNNHLLFTGTDGSPPPPGNAAPTASFTYSCTDLACTFTDTSTDSDGTIASWSWAFGDGSTSTDQHPSHSYAAGGSYEVTLTVTDDAGATGSTSQTVTVTAPTGGISLTATGYKVKGVQHAELSWTGSTSVQVYRDDAPVAVVSGTSHTDNIGNKGGGSYTYRVCDTGTGACSNNATVTF